MIGLGRQSVPVAPRTGAWIETCGTRRCPSSRRSPPARGRGSKQMIAGAIRIVLASPPARGRGSKLGRHVVSPIKPGRPPHGGVDRNTCSSWRSYSCCASPPARGRGSKLDLAELLGILPGRPPHGGVDRNAARRRCASAFLTSPPARGRGSKRIVAEGEGRRRRRPPHGGVDRNDPVVVEQVTEPLSPPHGGVDRNLIPACRIEVLTVAPRTGAWIETPPTAARTPPPVSPPARGRGPKFKTSLSMQRSHGCRSVRELKMANCHLCRIQAYI